MGASVTVQVSHLDLVYIAVDNRLVRACYTMSESTSREPTLLLPLHHLNGDRHPGVSLGIGACYLEAARVCLGRHHSSPEDFSLSDDDHTVGVRVEWLVPDDRLVGAWANEIDATEAGACACSIAAVDLSEGMVTVRRAETGTGADYYVAPPGESLDDLENCFRLEVSGTDRGDYREVDRRLRQKVAQAARGASNLPALACVVGFQCRVIRLRYVEQKL